MSKGFYKKGFSWHVDIDNFIEYIFESSKIKA